MRSGRTAAFWPWQEEAGRKGKRDGCGKLAEKRKAANQQQGERTQQERWPQLQFRLAMPWKVDAIMRFDDFDARMGGEGMGSLGWESGACPGGLCKAPTPRQANVWDSGQVQARRGEDCDFQTCATSICESQPSSHYRTPESMARFQSLMKAQERLYA